MSISKWLTFQSLMLALAGSMLIALLLISTKSVFLINKGVSPPLTKADFLQAKGYKLGYELFMTNSYTGWVPNKGNKFIYDENKQMYISQRLNISSPPIDSFGTRFKISSINWENEFGLVDSDSTIDQSKFGLSLKGTVLPLDYFANSKDIHFELSEFAKPIYLKVSIKIIANSYRPEALMYIEYTEK